MQIVINFKLKLSMYHWLDFYCLRSQNRLLSSFLCVYTNHINHTRKFIAYKTIVDLRENFQIFRRVTITKNCPIRPDLDFFEDVHTIKF